MEEPAAEYVPAVHELQLPYPLELHVPAWHCEQLGAPERTHFRVKSRSSTQRLDALGRVKIQINALPKVSNLLWNMIQACSLYNLTRILLMWCQQCKSGKLSTQYHSTCLRCTLGRMTGQLPRKC